MCQRLIFINLISCYSSTRTQFTNFLSVKRKEFNRDILWSFRKSIFQRSRMCSRPRVMYSSRRGRWKFMGRSRSTPRSRRRAKNDTGSWDRQRQSNNKEQASGKRSWVLA